MDVEGPKPVGKFKGRITGIPIEFDRRGQGGHYLFLPDVHQRGGGRAKFWFREWSKANQRWHLEWREGSNTGNMYVWQDCDTGVFWVDWGSGVRPKKEELVPVE